MNSTDIEGEGGQRFIDIMRFLSSNVDCETSHLINEPWIYKSCKLIDAAASVVETDGTSKDPKYHGIALGFAYDAYSIYTPLKSLVMKIRPMGQI